MSGLLSKAKNLRDSFLGRSAVAENESVAQKLRAEEEAEIAQEMDAILEKSRIQINAETLAYHAQSSGSRLPLLINLAALALVGGGIYLSALYFQQSEADIIAGDAQMNSTEGRIISALREESEAALAEKEAQLSTVRTQLDNLESDLRAQLDAELAAERERLLSAGASREELDADLEAFERERLAELNAEYQALQQSLEADQAALEAERERLMAEAAAAAESAEDAEALESEAATRLEQLRRQREEERLLGDQILSFYDTVNEELEGSDYPAALETLDQLEDFLGRPAISENPVMGERIDTERFLIDSLRRLISAETAPDEVQEEVSDPSGELLAQVGLLVEQGNEQFAAGEREAALGQYLDAMALIPSLETGYTRIREIETEREQAEGARLTTILNQGESLFSAGEYAESVERYRTALGLLDTDALQVDRLVENLLQSGSRLRALPAEDPNTELVSRIESLRREYATRKPASSGTASSEAVLTLLNAKVLMRQALAMPEVQAQFPDLYSETGKVFEAYGEEERSMGRTEALELAAGMLASLGEASADGPQSTETAVSDELSSEELEALDRFLENLEALLRD